MSDTKTIWITGANGFIGSELTRRLQDLGYRVVGTDKELSVAEPERLQAFAVELQPDVVINAAGIPRFATGIGNRIKAYETNAVGAMNVAVAANSVGAHMVHISTDDVYPQRMAEPANEFLKLPMASPNEPVKSWCATQRRITASSFVRHGCTAFMAAC